MPLPDGFQTLDVCRHCHTVWFDPGEFLTFPTLEVDEPQDGPFVDARVADAVGKFHLHQQKRVAKHRESIGRGPLPQPDASWKWIAGFLGLPVHMDDSHSPRTPWTTLSLLALIAVVSIASFSNLREIVKNFGFLPAEPLRLAGFTFVSSFFLHVDWFHLIGNGYFLWLFGAGTEEVLGRNRFLLLVSAATTVGHLAYMPSTADKSIPAIGASGGVSGVIAFYALRFPRVRIGLLFYWLLWVRLPVVAWFVLWVLLQGVGAMQMASRVGYMAHLGGAFVGLAFWIWGNAAGESDNDAVRIR